MDTPTQPLVAPQASVAETVPSLNPQTAKPAASKLPVPLPVIAAGAGAVVVAILVFLLLRTVMSQSRNPQVSKNTSTKKITLTWWGLWENSDTISGVIKQFQDEHPGVTITYVANAPKDYRERLQSAFTRGQGPDIFRFHNTWVPMLSNPNILSTLPVSTMSTTEYEKTFYPVVQKDLKTSTGYVGIPLMTDGLGLYVNKKALATSGKTAPATWEELASLSKALTVRGTDGKLERAGVALGSGNNVDHFSDIIALLILQNGGNPGEPADKNNLVSDALTFYTQFLNKDRVWDETLPNSTYAFATEKVAMIFAPSWRAFEIKQINPNIDFEIVPVPQLPGKPVTWASYWAEGVAKSSANPDTAWAFLKYLSSKEVLQKFYTQASSSRLFGEIYSRQDMASLLTSDPYAGAFVKQSANAKSWYMSSRTFDTGLNDGMIKYYQDAVNGLNNSKSMQEVLPTLTSGVAQVSAKYGVK